MSHEMLAYLAAGVVLVGLMAYAVLGGADFGGGVWDLFATGPRKRQQRDAIARAMGPVWEANHVWLVFVVVALFTCFPRAYAAMGIALFLPFHIALAGVMLRGAAFVFRGHSPAAGAGEAGSAWETVFGAASVISPFLLGAAFGALTAGTLFVGPGGEIMPSSAPAWLRPYSLACGALALSTCAYLAAVYLTVETKDALREDFRTRAIIAGTATAALAAIVLYLVYAEAHWFFQRLTAPRAWPVLGAGLFFFALSAYAVFTRRYRLSRVSSAAEIVLLLAGWGLAQEPYLAYPAYTLQSAAGPAATLRFMLMSVPFGAMLLLPSLWLLFRVFKRDFG